MQVLLRFLQHILLFSSTFKKAKKWSIAQIILILANRFNISQFWIIWPLKRPHGNHVKNDITGHLDHVNFKTEKFVISYKFFLLSFVV